MQNVMSRLFNRAGTSICVREIPAIVQTAS
jgi:hypothetical protein